MNKLDSDNCILLVIDIQEKLLNSVFNKETCEQNANIMVKVASALDIPILITEQYPKGLGATVLSLKESAKNELYFEKNTFSALENEELYKKLNNLEKKQIIIFGIETHICVSQTISDLISKGYEVHIIKNASSSRTESEHLAGLERIKDFGASIITTEIAMFELLRTSKHPKFKELQNLIK